MQPHSMCTLGLVQYIWNSSSQIEPKKLDMRVSYTNKDGLSRTLYYQLSNISINADNTEIKADIKRTSGSFSCTMTARRSSASSSSEITQTHSVQHKSGLREVYKLYEKTIVGQHYNSDRYGGFRGEQRHPDRTRYDLACDIKRDNGQWFVSTYKLEIL